MKRIKLLPMIAWVLCLAVWLTACAGADGSVEQEDEDDSPTQTVVKDTGTDGTLTQPDTTTKAPTEDDLPSDGEHVHNYSADVTAPTELDKGYTTYTCIGCGNSYVDDYVDALGYELTEGTMVFRADGVAYLYGADEEVIETYSGWMTKVYEVYEAPGAMGTTVPWAYDYYEGNPNITRVIIENGVNPKSTASWFVSCWNLETVIIGDSVEVLGRGMFERCMSLKTVKFSSASKLKTIEDQAFGDYVMWEVGEGTIHLPAITIPTTVTYLGSLPKTDAPVALHEGLVGIGEKVLSLDAGALPYSVTKLGAGNFTYLTIPDDHPVFRSVNNCLIEIASGTLIEVTDNFVIPTDGSILAIGKNAFAHSNITQITLPDGVKEIKEKAFYQCVNLTKVVLPDSLTAVGEKAFCYCGNLTDVNLPNSIVSIGDYAFSGCPGTPDLILPDNLTTVGESAFSGWQIKHLHISANVAEIGIGAFSGCELLETLTISEENTAYFVYDKCLIGKNDKTLVLAIGGTALPNDGSIKIIGDWAFVAKDAITTVVVPDGVIEIGDEVFYEWQSLARLVLPNSIEFMGQQCFSHSDNLRIEYKGTIKEWSNIGRHNYFAMSGNEYIVECTDGECDGYGWEPWWN